MDIKFLLNKATKLHLRGKLDKAEIIYNKIVKIDENNIIANSNLGSLFNVNKEYKKALNFLNKVLEIDPDFLDALNNKGISLKGLGKYHEAIKIFEKILELKPEHVDTLNNKANCLKSLDLLKEALEIYKKILNIKPNFFEAEYNQGVCFYQLDKFDDAIKSYKKAIKLNSNFVDAHYNLGLLELKKGNYHDGWKIYEWRKKKSGRKTEFLLDEQSTKWNGQEKLENKTILIAKEQGFGDYIQYCRYLPLIEKLGAKIILDTNKSLRPLIDTMNVKYNHINELKEIKFDYHCYIASLPLAFETTLKNIPNKTPYIFAPKNKKKYWQEKIYNKSTKKIGLKWSGNEKYIDDKNRSIDLNKLKPLFDLDYDYHSLDFELKENDQKILEKIPNLKFHGKDLLGLDNTAGLIDSLDMVISVDTGIAQLAASMGKTVWILLPHISDYRWLLNRDDSPWYPNVKLYRQTSKNDWENIIDIVKKDILIQNNN